MKQTIVAVATALAAMAGWAGESAEFRLDTMDGTRTARSVEAIACCLQGDHKGDDV